MLSLFQYDYLRQFVRIILTRASTVILGTIWDGWAQRNWRSARTIVVVLRLILVFDWATLYLIFKFMKECRCSRFVL